MKDQSPKSFSAVSLTVLILVALLLFSSSSPLLASSVFQNFLAQLRILGTNNQFSNSIFVDTDGKVGINTDNPQASLDIAGDLSIGTSSTEVVRPTGLQQVGHDSVLWFGGNSSLGSLQIKTASTGAAGDRFTITSGGNVGIGKTDPTTKLDVDGVVTATKFKNADGEELGGSFWTVDGNNIYREEGNVGIGTDSPGNKLQIAATPNDWPLKIRDDEAGVSLGFSRNSIRQRGSTFNIEANEGDIVFKTNPTPGKSVSNLTERMKIARGTGNVGIGTDNPSTELEVKGTITATKFKNANGDELGGSVWTKEGEAYVLNATTTLMSIGDNGNVSIGEWGNANPLLISNTSTMSSGAIVSIDKLHIKIINNSTAWSNRKAGIVFQQRTSASPRVAINSAIYTEKIDYNPDAVRMNLDVHDITALTIDNTGKVGIGTKTPQAKLHVNGGIYVLGGNGDVTGNGKLTPLDLMGISSHITNSKLLKPERYARADINGDGYVNRIDHKILLDTLNKIAGGSRDIGPLTVDERHAAKSEINKLPIVQADGKVGIGVENPGYKLDVNGDINTSGRYLVNGEETGLKNIILVENSECKNKVKGVTSSAGLTLVASCPSSHPNLLSCTGTPGPPRANHGWDIIPDYSNNKCTLIVQSPRCGGSWNQLTALQRVRATCFK